MELTKKQKVYILTEMFDPRQLIKDFNDYNVERIANKRLYIRKNDKLPYRYHLYEETWLIDTIDTKDNPEWEQYLNGILEGK